jgi:hypothetical protein
MDYDDHLVDLELSKQPAEDRVLFPKDAMEDLKQQIKLLKSLAGAQAKLLAHYRLGNLPTDNTLDTVCRLKHLIN